MWPDRHSRFTGSPQADLRQIAGAMTRSLRHRGPDAEGIWTADGIALGHRRLSILDLSPAGAQPMHSACGRYVIAFNGEIYNHLDLRRELEDNGAAPNWRGHSDTETLLAGIRFWGLDVTLERAAGMFAIALWDRRERRLSLARDRMGRSRCIGGGRVGLWFSVRSSRLSPLIANSPAGSAVKPWRSFCGLPMCQPLAAFIPKSTSSARHNPENAGHARRQWRPRRRCGLGKATEASRSGGLVAQCGNRERRQRIRSAGRRM